MVYGQHMELRAPLALATPLRGKLHQRETIGAA